MSFSDLIKESLRAILSNKTRSGLTVLGIVIGIASVIAMVSIGQGTQSMITSTIQNLGSNLLTIIPGAVMQGGMSLGRGTVQTLKIEDVGVVQGVSGVKYVSPEVSRRYQIIASTGLNTNSSVMGVSEDYLSVRNMTINNGSYFTESQMNNLSKVAVLGSNAVSDLFGDTDPINKTIRINKVTFRVIGVFETKGSSGFNNLDDMVFVPLMTMQKILTGNEYLSDIVVQVEDKNMMTQVQSDLTFALAEKHQVDPQNPDFSVISQADILSSLNQVTNTFTLFLSAIAGISLIVGGIGIMNMMLTNVTERTREIGLRKAIGAIKRDIVLQFLSEAIILTSIGGIIGIMLGYLLSILVGKVMSITTVVTPSAILLAFGVSAGIGIIFGYYPSRKAANLNPIDALRYE
ncbi:MAG: ABC transporter permease [Minisyncoccia bacterium]